MMPAVAPAPAMSRVVLAALCSLLVVGLVSWSAPASVAYGWGTPVIVGAGGVIWNRLGRIPQVARSLDTAMALLLLAPAIAARNQATELATWQLTVVATHNVLDSLLAYCAQATADTAPLLAAAAVGYLVLGGRAAGPGLGVLLASAAGAAAATAALFAAREAAASADYADVATFVRVVPWTGFFVLPGALLGMAFEGRPSRWTPGRTVYFALAGLGGLYAGTTPLERLLDTIAVPATRVLVPETRMGLTTTLAAVSGDPEEIERTFFERGHHRPRLPVWPCVTGAEPWGLRLRRSATLALPASASLAELDAAAAQFRVWSTARLALVGHADPEPRGPLAGLLAWPTLPLLLDRPQADATVVAVGSAGVRLIGHGDPPGLACVLVPDDDATIDHIYQSGRALLAPAGPCRGLALLPPEHRAAARTDPAAVRALGCSEEGAPPPSGS